jgi:hypothetical protein
MRAVAVALIRSCAPMSFIARDAGTCARNKFSNLQESGSRRSQQQQRRQLQQSGLPASKLIAALTEDDAPVIPDSDAAAAATFVQFVCNINGLM